MLLNLHLEICTCSGRGDGGSSGSGDGGSGDGSDGGGSSGNNDKYMYTSV